MTNVGFDYGEYNDELILELPEEEAEAQSKEVEQVLNTSMEGVLGNLVPVACEGVIADFWRKG